MPCALGAGSLGGRHMIPEARLGIRGARRSGNAQGGLLGGVPVVWWSTAGRSCKGRTVTVKVSHWLVLLPKTLPTAEDSQAARPSRSVSGELFRDPERTESSLRDGVYGGLRPQPKAAARTQCASAPERSIVGYLSTGSAAKRSRKPRSVGVLSDKSPAAVPGAGSAWFGRGA